MKKLFLILLLPLMFASAYGQAGQITAAAMSFQEGKYHDAIRDAKQGLSKPAELKEKQLLKGQSLLLRSYMMLYNEAQGDTSQKKLKALHEKYPTMTQDCWDAFQAIDKSADQEKKDEIKQLLRLLGNAYYYQSMDEEDAGKKDAALESMNRAIAAHKGAGDNFYFTHQRMGALLIGRKNNADSLKAIPSFETTVAIFEKMKPEEKKGRNVAGVYAALIQLYGSTKNDLSKASEVATKAKAQYPDDAAIKNAEYNIYSAPGMFDKAVARFKDEIAKNPNDMMAHRFYADLLTQKFEIESKDEKGTKSEAEVLKNFTEAEALYKKVLASGKYNGPTNYNLGALYNNKAYYYNIKLRADKIDPKEEDRMKTVRNENLKLALQHFEAYLPEDPKNVGLLRTLKNLSLNLADMDKVAKYNQQLKDLGVKVSE